MLKFSALLGAGCFTIMGIGSIIPLKVLEKGQSDCSITVYVSNIENFHSELMVPVYNSVFDWRSLIPLSEYFSKSEQVKFLSFGWGDETFFRTGSRDLGTVTRALFWPTSSVLHISGYQTLPRPTPSYSYQAVRISRAEYRRIVRDLKRSFKLNGTGLIQPIEPGLIHNSYFFRANGAYQVFNNCNHWTANLLRTGDINTPLVPIFPQVIVHFAESDCTSDRL